MSADLRLERRTQDNDTGVVGAVMITPFICPDYWAYRVIVGETQAVLGFPKFTTIGIGFAIEEDWNTNLPYTSPAEEIAAHIAHNRGPEDIPDDRILDAIRLIQSAVSEDRGSA